MVYAAVMRDAIERECTHKAYIYNDHDNEVLQQMLGEINALGHDYHYMAELSMLNISGVGHIVSKYIDRFESEYSRGSILHLMVRDHVPDCDLHLLSLYEHLKKSECYSIPRASAPCLRYDNAFERLKPKRIKKELVGFAYNAMDAFYLPFTMMMLARWKCPELEVLFQNYLENTPSKMEQLKFTSLYILRYYKSERSIELLSEYSKSENVDMRTLANKSLDVIKKR